MDFMERHHVKNLRGTIMHKNIPLVEFDIQNYREIYIRELNRKANYDLYPMEFWWDDAVTYGDIGDYVKHHVVEDGAQDVMGYLHDIGLTHYDLDEIVRRQNCYGASLNWIRFDTGIQTYEELIEQHQGCIRIIEVPD